MVIISFPQMSEISFWPAKSEVTNDNHTSFQRTVSAQVRHMSEKRKLIYILLSIVKTALTIAWLLKESHSQIRNIKMADFLKKTF